MPSTQQIVELKAQGKSYQEIADQLNCSEWTVKYHLFPNRKKNAQKYNKRLAKRDPLFLKRKRFITVGEYVPFSLEELREKLIDNPRCYLTGEPIDLSKPETYSLDHIIPVSRGGKSSLENLGLLKSDINQAKYDLTPEEFLLLCRRVLSGSPSR